MTMSTIKAVAMIPAKSWARWGLRQTRMFGARTVARFVAVVGIAFAGITSYVLVTEMVLNLIYLGVLVICAALARFLIRFHHVETYRDALIGLREAFQDVAPDEFAECPEAGCETCKAPYADVRSLPNEELPYGAGRCWDCVDLFGMTHYTVLPGRER